ncbi:MAG: hypothetical protein CBE07_003335 [Pelagibacteraceae bacterium TMED247]|nr:MAG: hypothetical protein CBE07_003335 [Pelagibacteraceae bacterium TMED247]|tara:strand:+ start:7455 stop:7925 length:471 start_codon:yes stop_codon:yes gene_type:complete
MKKILITILCTSVLASCAVGWRIPESPNKEWNDDYNPDAWREHFRECAAFLESEDAWHWCMNNFMEDANERLTTEEVPIEDTTRPNPKPKDPCLWANTDYEHLECPNLIHTNTHTIEDTTVPKSTEVTTTTTSTITSGNTIIGITWHGHPVTVNDL